MRICSPEKCVGLESENMDFGRKMDIGCSGRVANGAEREKKWGTYVDDLLCH